MDSDYIKSYCLGKFSNYRLCSDGRELLIPSIFLDNDWKRHMSINLETGLWRCFKSGETGNFLRLYSLVENVTYRKAFENFAFDMLMNEDKPKPKPIEDDVVQDRISYKFTGIPADNLNEIESLAAVMLIERGFGNLVPEFMTCDQKPFHSRLIIPFRRLDGSLFFFQARSLLEDQWPKYLNCRAFKSSHVLYPFDYESSEPLYVTEGVFDAIALRMLGLKATSTLSSTVSNIQIAQLKQYNGPIVVAFDSDTAGQDGLKSFYRMAMKYKFPQKLHYTSPIESKDWNEMYVNGTTKSKIEDSVKELNDIELAVMRL